MVTIASYKVVQEDKNQKVKLIYSDGSTHDYYHILYDDEGSAFATSGEEPSDNLLGKEKQDNYIGY